MAARWNLLKGWALLTAVVAAAAALLLQCALLLTGPGAAAGVAMATLRFCSYFTVLSNLAVCLGCVWIACGRHLPAPLAATLALCIGVTGLVYGLVLQRSLGPVLLVPVAYLGWAMLCGALTGQVPYPFLDLQRIGVAAFSGNVLRVAGVFVLGWTALWALDRWRGR
ncbi:Pr6Pr family membrane protein [Stenotrophomonas sp. S48]|uniref:Pr6Pr family membrane protein n=1 Tax=unclassified Stenotrophomonas TaxID=196198 RepID=UPI0018FF1ED7|nr:MULTISPECIES: Pr6Pr family membrane protein [unclassified Stenotrophomonas]MBK0026670.1 Pr6Pr family membrane protein [Stenotrophomonas sp. S48]MBK0049494.1 Pr6Pr family membrane protein [Stenotrophomonas sp. S49]